MKIIPLYLPQFHEIPENNEWWGKGFTEWTNVRKAMPMFEGHYQPRIPLNENYYDLSEISSIKWQCKLAKKYGIYGFCFYHYWFNGKKLLHKPMELLLENEDIDINFCISWANENWTNGWVSDNNKILIGHNFDDESDWKNHFYYLLKFFKDKRYIVEENKPLLMIYVPHHIKKLDKLLQTWNNMAKSHGFDGIKFIYQNVKSHLDLTMDKSLFDYGVEFEPGFSSMINASKNRQLLSIWAPKISGWIQKRLGLHLSIFNRNKKVTLKSYDETWKSILSRRPSAENMIPSAFVGWDNTPRRGQRGEVYQEATPEKFKFYLKKLIEKTRSEYKSDKMFIFAWNEWAEGGYLEPDEKYGYKFLEAIHESLFEDNKEIS